MGVHIAETCIVYSVASGAQGYLSPISGRLFGGIGMEDSPPMCGYCNFATAARRKCPCRRVRYCDELCQTRDWRRRRDECTWRAGVVFLDEGLNRREPFFDQCVVKLLARFLGC